MRVGCVVDAKHYRRCQPGEVTERQQSHTRHWQRRHHVDGKQRPDHPTDQTPTLPAERLSGAGGDEEGHQQPAHNRCCQAGRPQDPDEDVEDGPRPDERVLGQCLLIRAARLG